MAWSDYVNSAGIIAALGISTYQTRRLVLDARSRDQESRRQRALELYRDLVVEGDTAKAFESLSVLLRTEGARRFSTNTWHLMKEEEFQSGGMLDPSQPGLDTTFQNFYRIIWYFERVKYSMEFGLADPDVIFATIGFHCWWWGQLLKNINSVKAISALHALAPLAADWARQNGMYTIWRDACLTDFDGAAPVEFSV